MAQASPALCWEPGLAATQRELRAPGFCLGLKTPPKATSEQSQGLGPPRGVPSEEQACSPPQPFPLLSAFFLPQNTLSSGPPFAQFRGCCRLAQRTGVSGVTQVCAKWWLHPRVCPVGLARMLLVGTIYSSNPASVSPLTQAPYYLLL